MRTILLAAITVAAASTTHAVTQIHVAETEILSTLVSVELWLDVDDTCGPCCVPVACRSDDVVVTISPCPPTPFGCPGGSAEIPLAYLGDVANVQLARGVRYTITAAWSSVIETRTDRDCTAPCTFGETAEPFEYYSPLDPETRSYWVATPLVGGSGTVRTRVQLVSDFTRGCGITACSTNWIIRLNVSPPVPGYPDILFFTPEQAQDGIELDLVAGGTYYFSGFYDWEDLTREQSGACAASLCSNRYYTETTEYVASPPLPTRQSTWGAVKALYR